MGVKPTHSRNRGKDAFNPHAWSGPCAAEDFDELAVIGLVTSDADIPDFGGF